MHETSFLTSLREPGFPMRSTPRVVIVSATLFLLLTCAAGADDQPTAASADASPSFTELFTGSPCGEAGTLGCMNEGKVCNPDWRSYFAATETSISLTAGGDCRTVSTFDRCRVTLGDEGITAIRFDFAIADSCHGADGLEWLAFWMYRLPWQKTVEVDFIETRYGPSPWLNSNFAETGHQVVIFDDPAAAWTGSIDATFSGRGDAVHVEVRNSHNDNVATTTLTASDGYFFVLDTATGSAASDCTITISNLRASGRVDPAAGNCQGLID